MGVCFLKGWVVVSYSQWLTFVIFCYYQEEENKPQIKLYNVTRLRNRLGKIQLSLLPAPLHWYRLKDNLKVCFPP